MDLALTLDYELYGDGSGDVFEDIIKPTEILLSLLDKHKIKITIFFEVVEYWKLDNEWKNGNKMNYTKNPVEAIKNNLCVFRDIRAQFQESSRRHDVVGSNFVAAFEQYFPGELFWKRPGGFGNHYSWAANNFYFCGFLFR